jgi:hypothetical protein
MLEERLQHIVIWSTSMTTPTLRRIGLAVAAAGQLVMFTTPVLAQQGPPITGVTGSVVPDGKGDGATTAIGAGAGKVIEGTKKILHPGGKEDKQKDVDPLATLELGTKVVIHPGDLAAQQNASSRTEDKSTEGTVIELDHKTRVIVLRLAADRTTQRLRLDEAQTQSQDARPAPDAGDKVTLSYTDTNGDRAQHVFRIVP